MVNEVGSAPLDRKELLLVLPGVAAALACAGAHAPRLPALELLCARASRSDGANLAMTETFARALPTLSAAAHAPVAPLSRVDDTLRLDGGWCARADPVHLAAMHDHVRLVPDPQPTPEEAAALVASCNELLAPEACALEAPHSRRWYLHAPRALDFTAADPGIVAGLDVFAHLPSGRDAAFARRLLTELQMLLHEHPVNRAREVQGRLTINSVWLWGAGVLPGVVPAAGLPPLWSDEPVARGLWRVAGGAVHPLPERLTAVEPGVLATRALEAAASSGDALECATRLERIDSNWLDPIVRALRNGTLAGARLVLGGMGQYLVDRRCLARWWRRVRRIEPG
jgi:hypothetical protein